MKKKITEIILSVKVYQLFSLGDWTSLKKKKQIRIEMRK